MNEQHYVDAIVEKDGSYWTIKLVGDNGIKYPVGAVKSYNEALHLRDVELKNL